MSFIYEYVTSYWNTPHPLPPSDKKYLITIDDLKSVNLQPVSNIVPAPSRNMPPMYDKVDLSNLNKAQLYEILNVKLKPVDIIHETKTYEPRHPVLKELINKINKLT